jgi:hypothetical protein
MDKYYIAIKIMTETMKIGLDKEVSERHKDKILKIIRLCMELSDIKEDTIIKEIRKEGDL